MLHYKCKQIEKAEVAHYVLILLDYISAFGVIRFKFLGREWKFIYHFICLLFKQVGDLCHFQGSRSKKKNFLRLGNIGYRTFNM